MKDKSPPCRHPRLFAGKWVLSQFQDLLISVGKKLPGLSEVRARILGPPDFVGSVAVEDVKGFLTAVQAITSAIPASSNCGAEEGWSAAVSKPACTDFHTRPLEMRHVLQDLSVSAPPPVWRLLWCSWRLGFRGHGERRPFRGRPSLFKRGSFACALGHRLNSPRLNSPRTELAQD